MSATGKAKKTGFTLIEMLVVLAVLGLITGIAFPAVERASAQQRYRLATSEVESALRNARATAVARDAETSFVPPPVPEDIVVTTTRGGIRFYEDGSANGGSVAVAMGQRRSQFGVDAVTGLITLI